VNNSLSVLHGCEDAKSQRFWGHDLDLLGLRDVIGNVTNRLAMATFLLVIYDDHASILHRYGDIKPQICVQPMLRSKSLLRMPSVMWPVDGEVKNDYIFGVTDAILPIHYTTSMGLQ